MRPRSKEIGTVVGTDERACVVDTSLSRPPSDDPAREWYWVAALYKAVHVGVPRKRHLWERTVFLVQATSDAEAAQTAERVAREKEHEYVAAAGDLIRWTFQYIEDIQSLLDEAFEEGTEVYWTCFERV